MTKFDNLVWDSGCCAETVQIASEGNVVLVTHTYEGDVFRIETFRDNRFVSEQNGLTREQAIAIVEALPD